MAKDEMNETSESSESSESSEESEYDSEEGKKVTLISQETQYINAMVAKIHLENEKNHPERSSKNVWEMLYGDMENFDVSSSDESRQGESSSEEGSSDYSSEDEHGSGEITDDQEDGGLMDVMNTMRDFIVDPQERDRALAEGKRKKKLVKKVVKKREGEPEPLSKGSDVDHVAPEDKNTSPGAQPLPGGEVEAAVEVEVEVEETAEEEEARCFRENSERIAKELADAQQEWLVLHSWLIEFRLKHNMTVLDFMEYAGAERDMARSWQVKQLLNRTGHKFNPSESHATWGGRTRKLLKGAKAAAESEAAITHKQYMQLRLLYYRAKEFSPDNELQYTLRLGYVSPKEEVEPEEDTASISKKMSIEQSHSDDLSELRENSCMAAEDENILHQKYTTVHEDNVPMRSTFKYESGSDISDSDDSFGDTDSSSGDEFFWVGGAEGHNTRKERRKMVREDLNTLHEMFDTPEERLGKEQEKERRDREAREEAERCPSDVAGKIAWRLRRLEVARSKQAAEEEGKRIEQNMKDRAARARRRALRKRIKEKKQRAMAVLRAVTQPETLFI